MGKVLKKTPKCSGRCKAHFTFKGDGFCDDANNNCACDWDGGDCCKLNKPKAKKHCSLCQCLDPKAKASAKKKKPKGCWVQKFRKDGHCDDLNNFKVCQWDGGDCCNLGTSLLHCSKKGGDDKKCKCLNPEGQRKDKKCKSYCKIMGFVGDGNCDDPNNTCGCNWDGGDCCGPKNKYLYCSNCKCQNPSDKKYYAGTEGLAPKNTRGAI